MDRLKADLKHMVAQATAHAKKQSIHQLTDEVSAFSDTIKNDASALPQRIKDIITENFVSVGWDIRYKVVRKPHAFTPDAVVNALTHMLSEIENWQPVVMPTPAELGSLSLACGKLWDLDTHRLVPGRDYVIDVQKGKGVYDQGDAASRPLFSFVDEKVLTLPTFESFIALLDNYTAETGKAEIVDAAEIGENNRFLNAIMDTAVMQYVHQYLLAKGVTKARERSAFIQELNQLWFGLYKRKVANDSSGFEHVFVGETAEKNGALEIIGFHNWITIYLEEKKRNSTFDYQGYIKPKRKGTSLPTSSEQLLTMQFFWRGAMKNIGSSFIGTSPEFEVALYTLCFYSGQDENIVQCGPYKVKMTCYTYNQGPKKFIATSFPSEAPLDEHEAATKIQGGVRARNFNKKH